VFVFVFVFSCLNASVINSDSASSTMPYLARHGGTHIHMHTTYLPRESSVSSSAWLPPNCLLSCYHSSITPTLHWTYTKPSMLFCLKLSCFSSDKLLPPLYLSVLQVLAKFPSLLWTFSCFFVLCPLHWSPSPRLSPSGIYLLSPLCILFTVFSVFLTNWSVCSFRVGTIILILLLNS
jgi:hypothetical protein